jgi:hypothetical protein
MANELQTLRSQWYQKLKDEGFKDIEDSKGRLKRHDTRTIAFENRELIRQFHMDLASYLDSQPDISQTEYRVLELYSQGSRIIKIAELVNRHKSTVHTIIKNYKTLRFHLSRKIEMNPWHVRKPLEADIPFIYSTWLKAYRYGSSLGKSCRNSIFFDEYNKVIDNILANPEVSIQVACMPENHEIIFGYCVTQKPNIIHFVFVKDAFTRNGIAKCLTDIGAEEIIYTHKTQAIKEILTKYPNLTYNPFLLFKQGGLNG